MNRPVAIITISILVVLAGCAGGGDRTPEPIRGEASAATVTAEGLSTTGYEEVATEQERVNRTGTIDVSGDVELTVNYQVKATAQQAVYHKSDGNPPSVFALYSVPLVSPDQVDITIDPLGDRSLSEIATLSQEAYSDFGEFQHVGNSSVSFLGTETTLQKFTTTAVNNGESIKVVVYVTTVKHEGDQVRVVSVLPQTADNPDAIRKLIQSIQH